MERYGDDSKESGTSRYTGMEVQNQRFSGCNLKSDKDEIWKRVMEGFIDQNIDLEFMSMDFGELVEGFFLVVVGFKTSDSHCARSEIL